MQIERWVQYIRRHCGEASPHSYATSAKAGPNNCAAHWAPGRGRGASRCAAACEWPIHRPNSVRGATGKTSPSWFSINPWAARRHTRKPISISPVHQFLSTILLKKHLFRKNHGENYSCSKHWCFLNFKCPCEILIMSQIKYVKAAFLLQNQLIIFHNSFEKQM